MTIENMVIFFSWQSDIANNTKIIRQALNRLKGKLQSKHNITVSFDEATKREAGSIDIPKTIFEKITKCDIFIGDVTTITSCEGLRPCPNPNVMLEAGFAAAECGWERCILLFNDEIGNFNTDLPFDLEKRRILRFATSEGRLEALEKDLESSINAIINKNPSRPIDQRSKSEGEIKKERDYESLRWLMSSIHVPTVQEQIEEFPRVIDERALFIYDHVEGITSNMLFHLYDKRLEQTIRSLVSNWGGANSYSGFYHERPGGFRHYFTNPGDMPLTGSKEAAWQAIDRFRIEMNRAFAELLDIIRVNYLEIDIRDTNRLAHGKWQEHKAYLDSLVNLK